MEYDRRSGQRETADEVVLRMIQTSGHGPTVSPGAPWIPERDTVRVTILIFDSLQRTSRRSADPNKPSTIFRCRMLDELLHYFCHSKSLIRAI